MTCRVYLAGLINKASDAEAKDWRKLATEMLVGRGWKVLDPMTRDYRGREMEPGIATAIVEGDKQDIDSCDYLLVNALRPSWGTAMEIMYAWERDKTVVVVHPPDPSPWLVYHSSARFSTIEEAIQWLTAPQ